MNGTGENELIGMENASLPENQALLEMINRDSALVLEKLIQQYSDEVAAFANRLLGWPGDVDDIVQDVFLAVFENLKKFRHESSIKTWLFKITINRCRTYKYGRFLKLKFFLAASKREIHYESDSGQNVLDKEKNILVRKAVSALPAVCREAVVLKYLQQLDTGQILEILGIGENVLNVRLSRARKILKDKLSFLMEE